MTAVVDDRICTFKIGPTLVGVPVLDVQEVIPRRPLTAVPRSRRHVRGLLNLRGLIVTTIDLLERVGVGITEMHDQTMNVVVLTEAGPVSFLADSVGDVISPDSNHFERVPDTLSDEARAAFSCAYKYGDELVFLIDLKYLAGTPAQEAVC